MTPQEFRAIRRRLNLNQADLAQLLGYSMSLTISGFERKTNPKPVPRHLDLLMQALDTGFWPEGWPRNESSTDTGTGGERTGDRRRHVERAAEGGRDPVHQHRPRSKA